MFKKILVPTDGSGHAEKAVELAADLAHKYAAELIILNVRRQEPLPDELLHMAEVEHLVEPVHARIPQVADTSSEVGAAMANNELRARELSNVQAKLSARIVEQARDLARAKGVENITESAIEGDPARCILDTAREAGVDLIVMGSRGLSDIKGLLVGSVSHKVSQLCDCTCVTVK